MKEEYKTVDEYISLQPGSIGGRLIQIRKLILNRVPEATESIAYNMPAYKTYGKPLIYFAAYKTHIGLYATPSGHERFKKELSKYKSGKGSVQFPLQQELPLDLITRIIDFRANENKEKFG